MEGWSVQSGALRLRFIFGVATVLGFFSAFTAYYYVTTFGQRGKASFPMLLLLNLSYWYSWALIAPAILWLARRFPFERASWLRSIPVHVGGVFASTLAHVSLFVLARFAIYTWWGESSGVWWMEAQRLFFLQFDWEMMTYWAIVGVSHALRYQYEAQDRALRASRLETRLMEAQLQTLQRQLQPHFLFNTLNTISALMHRDVEAADAMLARLGDLLRLSFETLGVQEVALAQELDFLQQVRSHRAGAVPGAARRDLRHRARRARIVRCQTFCCSRSSKTPSGTASDPGSAPGHVLVRAARAGSMLELEVRDDGVGVPASRLPDLERGVGLSNTRSRLGAPLRRPAPLRGAAAGRRRDCRWSSRFRSTRWPPRPARSRPGR